MIVSFQSAKTLPRMRSSLVSVMPVHLDEGEKEEKEGKER